MCCKASSRITACTVICSHLVVLKAISGNFLIRACTVKLALESTQSYDDRLIVVEKSNDPAGSHEPTHGQPVQRTRMGSTSLKPRITRVQRTRMGSTSLKPRTSRVQRTRTGSTSLKPRTTRVQRTRNGVYSRQIKEYPRGDYTQRGSHQSIHGLLMCSLHATEFTQVKPRTSHVEHELRGLHQSIHGLLQEAKDTLAH